MMGTKAEPGPHDCYAAAATDEPMFVLLARDPDAPELVRRWAAARQTRKGGQDPKAIEAIGLADEMERWAGQGTKR